MIVHILPQNIKIEVEKGRRLYQVLEELGMRFDSSCNGMGTCGKCKIHITKGCNPPSNKDLEVFTIEELNKGMRLACHVNVMDDMVLLYKKNKDSRRIESIAGDVKVNSYNSNSNYGVAIDVGTTNIIAILWNMEKKEQRGVMSIENPQRMYGLDVVSRITYGTRTEENEAILHKQLLYGCYELLNKLCKIYKIDRERIKKISYVGNTTMVYSLLKRPLIDLVKVPFIKVDYRGANWNDNGEHNALPLIQGHVGSDALGCIISTKIHKRAGKYLIVDIGTNGELILSDDGNITVCSTAAGPAFEAANISCGMIAEEGAITGIEIISDEIELKYIGEEKRIPPLGICGSGLVDIIAKLYINQWMDDAGRLLGEYGENNEVILYKDNKKKLSLKQKDIREFQLAKAAIATGVMFLLRDKKLRMEDLDEIYIAGALGSHISCENLFTTGILPRVSLDKVKFIGNAALDGCSKFLLNEYSVEETQEIAKKANYIELANKEGFQEKFIKNINFNRHNKQ